ncbi:glycosyltransferase family 4 protein [Leucobacter albus]|uniref:Glycosyltransferase family 4 protein n=1 Tax=Leucobacter albus TaxID=272210 RepID=A0ABW3TLA3_9MICO
MDTGRKTMNLSNHPPQVEVDQYMPTFVPGGVGGGETYARKLFQALDELAEVSVHAVVTEGASGFAPDAQERVISGVKLDSSVWGRLRGVAGVLVRGRKVTRLLRPSAVTFTPFTIPVLPKRKLGKKLVMTVHDLQHRELPELFSLPEKLWRSLMYEHPARRADHIITDSEYSKKSIVKHLGVDESRVTAIPLGADVSGFTPNLAEREAFVYYPARGWKHKNHSRLIEAMKIVREERPEMRLVLTGGALDAIGDVPTWVDVKGLVTFEEVTQLLQKASVLAFPSLFEGFGLPPLEAMASGCPVAASNAASIPEVCGDAAVYFDPRNTEEMAEAILAAIDDRDALVRKGLERAASFPWALCAERHVQVFREVLTC